MWRMRALSNTNRPHCYISDLGQCTSGQTFHIYRDVHGGHDEIILYTPFMSRKCYTIYFRCWSDDDFRVEWPVSADRNVLHMNVYAHSYKLSE